MPTSVISSVYSLVILFRLKRIIPFAPIVKHRLSWNSERVWGMQSERKNELPVYRVFRLA